eukprot:7242680-Prymnesium_polylepis.1
MLNKWTKRDVVAQVTVSYLCKYIRRLNFTHIVHRGLERILHRNRAEPQEKLKNIDNDVAQIKEYL